MSVSCHNRTHAPQRTFAKNGERTLFSWYRGDSKTCRRKLLPDWNRNFTVCSTPWSFQSAAKVEGGEKKNPAGFSLSRMSSSLFGLVLISMEATQPVLSIFWRSRHDSNMRPTV
jgi:hypothetical protein